MNVYVDERIFVNEIFGPTIQGEGSAAGRHCLFVRVADCNLECKWCDTPYTWAFTQKKADKLEVPGLHDRQANRIPMTANEIIAQLQLLWPIHEKPTMVVISGGEPLMQQRRLVALMQQLYNFGCDIHIETAGTIVPEEDFDYAVTQYNVSPKLEHSGNRLELRRKPEALRFFGKTVRAHFKFVVRSAEDFAEVDEVVRITGASPKRVMVMPEGVTVEANLAIARDINYEAIKRGYGLSFRTHILLWKDVRGK